MGSWFDQRKSAAGGMLAMLLLLVGNFMAGSPPKFAADAATVVHFYSSHHRAILIGSILTGLAVPLYVWFVAQLALAIRGPLGAAIALGGLLVAACAATGDALTATGAQAAHTGGDAASIRLLYQVADLAYSRLFWAGLAVAVPLGIAVAAGALRPWVRYVAWLQAAVYLLGGVSLKAAGFFSPTGGMPLIGYLVFFLGTLVTAFALWQASPAEATAHGAAPSLA